MSATKEIYKIPCDDCGGKPKNHKTLYEFQTNYDDPEGEHGGGLHQVCQCLGCDNIKFREEFWNSFEIDEHGDPCPYIRIFPDTSNVIRKPENTIYFPDNVARIYTETIKAVNCGAKILAGAGLRSIVESICKDMKISERNLEKSIDELHKKGLLTQSQADLLHEERYLGNKALHEIEEPKQQDLFDGLDILEVLLNTIYVLPEKARKLKRNREKSAKKIDN